MAGHSHGPVLLLAHPTMDPLAVDVAAASGGRIEYQSDRLQWGKFADGFPDLFINEVKDVANRDVVLLCCLHQPAVIFEQMCVMYAIPRYLVRSFTILLPYFPCATMERVDTEGQIATAKSVTRLISATPLSRRGPAQVVIFDIHALQERFYFTDNVIPRMETAVPLLYPALRELQGAGESLAVAFPDDGAHKRFHTLFKTEAVEMVICNKIRQGDERIVQIKEGDPSGRHVIIVDDLVQTGGTLLECAKCLKQRGAVAVSAYVTHAIFPNEAWRKFSPELFKNFWVTDSMPLVRRVLVHHEPFRLLTLASSMVQVVLNPETPTNSTL